LRLDRLLPAVQFFFFDSFCTQTSSFMDAVRNFFYYAAWWRGKHKLCQVVVAPEMDAKESWHRHQEPAGASSLECEIVYAFVDLTQ